MFLVLRLEISGLKQRLKKTDADKKKLELKITAKKGQLVEAREKITAQDRSELGSLCCLVPGSILVVSCFAESPFLWTAPALAQARVSVVRTTFETN